MKYTIEQIKKAYKKSSPKIREILDDVWVTNICGEIGRDLNLRIDKIDILIRVVGLTLLNIVSISNFAKTVEKELVVSSANASTITKKVDQLIFKKVREIVLGNEGSIDTEIDTENNDITVDLMNDIENRADDNMSFKDKFNKVTVKKVENRIVDPYRESID